MSIITRMPTTESEANHVAGRDQPALKKGARRLVAELAVVIALVGYTINFPHDTSFAQAWRFVLTHPPVLLHVIVGTLILVEAFALLIRAIISRQRSWIALAVFGLACVLIAYATGELYVANQHTEVLTYMSIGWFGAIVAYGFGWYWGRARAKS